MSLPFRVVAVVEAEAVMLVVSLELGGTLVHAGGTVLPTLASACGTAVP